MPGSNYKSIISEMTWSYSRLTTFEDCPYRWLLKYLYEYDDDDMFYASYGSFIHKIIEKYYRGELSKEQMVYYYLNNFSGEVRGERPPGDISAKYVMSGVEYLKSFLPFPFEMVDVEKKVEFRIKDIPFVGYIDYLGIDNGELVIVDNKSRDIKPRSKRKTPTQKDEELDNMLRQLYLYSEAVFQEYGKYPSVLCFNCYRSGTLIREPFVMGNLVKTLEWAESTVREIENTDLFNPHIEFFPCKYICGVHNECCFNE